MNWQKIVMVLLLVAACMIPFAVAQAVAPRHIDGHWYQWKLIESDPGRWYLYKDGKQLGGWDKKGEYYRPLLSNGNWGSKCEPPIIPPDMDNLPPLNFGVDTSKLSPGSYRINGKEVSREQAFDAVKSGSLMDDSKLLRLTLIGPKQVCESALTAIRNSKYWGEWKDKLLVQWYPPGHFLVDRVGFKTDGNPTIYLQATTGEVLHRQDDFQGGAEELFGAVRKANDDYNAEKDPDRRKPDPSPPLLPSLPDLSGKIDLSKVPIWVWILIGIGLYLFLKRDK